MVLYMDIYSFCKIVNMRRKICEIFPKWKNVYLKCNTILVVVEKYFVPFFGYLLTKKNSKGNC